MQPKVSRFLDAQIVRNNPCSLLQYHLLVAHDKKHRNCYPKFPQEAASLNIIGQPILKMQHSHVERQPSVADYISGFHT